MNNKLIIEVFMLNDTTSSEQRLAHFGHLICVCGLIGRRYTPNWIRSENKPFFAFVWDWWDMVTIKNASRIWYVAGQSIEATEMRISFTRAALLAAAPYNLNRQAIECRKKAVIISEYFMPIECGADNNQNSTVFLTAYSHAPEHPSTAARLERQPKQGSHKKANQIILCLGNAPHENKKLCSHQLCMCLADRFEGFVRSPSYAITINRLGIGFF